MNKSYLFIAIFFGCFLLGSISVLANISPIMIEFELNASGTSHLYWAFSEPFTDWNLTAGNLPGQGDHLGEDYYAQDWNYDDGGNSDAGKNLRAVGNGTVIYVDTNHSNGDVAQNDDCLGSNYGNQVIIQLDDNPDFTVRYSHMQDVYVDNDVTVETNDVIGTVGYSGLSGDSPCYAHLHLVLYQNDEAADFDLDVNNLEQPISSSVAAGEWKYYRTTTADSTIEVEFEVTGLTGDVDLYVRKDERPDQGTYNCASEVYGLTEEVCEINNTESSTWRVGVYGYESSEYTLTTTWRKETEGDFDLLARIEAEDDEDVTDSDGDGLDDGLENEIGTDPNNSDTDNDGLSDGYEVEHGYAPLLADGDGDGLLDGEEVELGTSTVSSDSDDDGVKDGEEIEYGTSPTNADTDGDGVSDYNEEARIYRIDDDGDGYTEQQGDCDDSNVGVYPDAPEICEDGIDQDCVNGDLSCGEGPDVDNDLDGYTENQGDCNDYNTHFYPEAPEVCDGGDNDCDDATPIDPGCNDDADGDGLNGYGEFYSGTDPTDADTDGDHLMDGREIELGYDPLTYTDIITPVMNSIMEGDDDGDGYDSLDDGGDDCDDNNAAVYEGASEICGDEVDQDCNGLDTYCDTDSDGVTDNLDVCPNTLPLDGNDTVDADGCALSQRDNDGDGLTNHAEIYTYATDPNNTDTDGDRLQDGWEINGANGIDLPSMGANPRKKDLFAEIDWMKLAGPTGHDHKAKVQAINTTINNFSNLTAITNPDGTTGVALHVDTGIYGGGTQITHDDDLNPVWSEFDAIKATRFSSTRLGIFDYVIMAHKYNGACNNNGNSHGIPATDHLIVMGCTATQVGTAVEQSTALTKELKKSIQGW